MYLIQINILNFKEEGTYAQGGGGEERAPPSEEREATETGNDAGRLK